MTTLPLDSRQARISRRLLVDDGLLSLDRIASELGLTPRVVRYNLPPVEEYLAGHGLRVLKRRGVGLWLEGGDGSRAAALAALDQRIGPSVLDAVDRQTRVIVALLQAAPEPVRSESFEAELGVSRATIRRDIRAVETWFEHHRLHLRRLPGVGVTVRGSEVDLRAALLALLLETIPDHVLIAVTTGEGGGPLPASRGGGLPGAPPGLADFLVELDLPTARSVLTSELTSLDETSATLLTATLSLAILAMRVRAGRGARLVRGRLRSLLDHPVADAARRISRTLAARHRIGLGPTEIAAITESLLGFVELADTRATADEALVSLADRLVEMAARRLHPSLADDPLLRESLAEHVRRLDVRLRYGLPVANPLQQEVQKRYPDVFRVASEIVDEISGSSGMLIPPEEVGFLTMYLAGSLERHRLQPKVRVTVVCPAGMATAWILVSRLLAEFPQLEIAQVVSKTAFEVDPEVATDIVVSTVPLLGLPARIPSLVVSPLLAERDIRRLGRLLELPTPA